MGLDTSPTMLGVPMKHVSLITVSSRTHLAHVQRKSADDDMQTVDGTEQCLDPHHALLANHARL